MFSRGFVTYCLLFFLAPLKCYCKLVAIVEGDTAFGTAFANFNPNDSIMFSIHVKGLESDCVGCKVSITDGESCDNVGENYYNPLLSEDPWASDNSVYRSNAVGESNSAFLVDNGYSEEDNLGHTVAIFAADGSTVLACGLLETNTGTATLIADLGAYPGYTGDIVVSGNVMVEFDSNMGLNFSYHVLGVESNCTDCGIHIHAGTSCDTHEQVLGHEWNSNYVEDLWTTAGGAVYNSDSDGEAKGSFMIYNGFNYFENNHHATVVHAQDGTRIACGVLYPASIELDNSAFGYKRDFFVSYILFICIFLLCFF